MKNLEIFKNKFSSQTIISRKNSNENIRFPHIENNTNKPYNLPFSQYLFKPNNKNYRTIYIGSPKDNIKKFFENITSFHQGNQYFEINDKPLKNTFVFKKENIFRKKIFYNDLLNKKIALKNKINLQKKTEFKRHHIKTFSDVKNANTNDLSLKNSFDNIKMAQTFSNNFKNDIKKKGQYGPWETNLDDEDP